ncbi:MAG: hypothetical protein QW035_04300 [Candidatus Anstonellales archaeon]
MCAQALMQEEPDVVNKNNKETIDGAIKKVKDGFRILDKYLPQTEDNPLLNYALGPLKDLKPEEPGTFQYYTLGYSTDFSKNPSLALNNPLTVLEYLRRVMDEHLKTLKEIRTIQGFEKNLTIWVGGKDDPYSKNLELYSKIFMDNKEALKEKIKQAKKSATGNTKLAFDAVEASAKAISEKNPNLKEEDVEAAIWFQLLKRNGGFSAKEGEDKEVIEKRVLYCFEGLVKGMNEGWAFNTVYGGNVNQIKKELTSTMLSYLISDERLRQEVSKNLKEKEVLALVVKDVTVNKDGSFTYTVTGVIFKDEENGGLKAYLFDEGKTMEFTAKEVGGVKPSYSSFGFGQLSPMYVHSIYYLIMDQIILHANLKTKGEIAPPPAPPQTQEIPKKMTSLNLERAKPRVPNTAFTEHEVTWSLKVSDKGASDKAEEDQMLKTALNFFMTNGITISVFHGTEKSKEQKPGKREDIQIGGEAQKGINQINLTEEQKKALLEGHHVKVTIWKREFAGVDWLLKDAKAELWLTERNGEVMLHIRTKVPLLGKNKVMTTYTIPDNLKSANVNANEQYKLPLDEKGKPINSLQVDQYAFRQTIEVQKVLVNNEQIKLGENNALIQLYQGLGIIDQSTGELTDEAKKYIQQFTNDLFMVLVLPGDSPGRKKAAYDLLTLLNTYESLKKNFAITIGVGENVLMDKLTNLYEGDYKQWDSFVEGNNSLKTIRDNWQTSLNQQLGEGRQLLEVYLPVLDVKLAAGSVYLDKNKSLRLSGTMGLMFLDKLGYELYYDPQEGLTIKTKKDRIEKLYATVELTKEGASGTVSVSIGTDPSSRFGKKYCSAKFQTAQIGVGGVYGSLGGEVTHSLKTNETILSFMFPLVFPVSDSVNISVTPYKYKVYKGGKGTKVSDFGIDMGIEFYSNTSEGENKKVGRLTFGWLKGPTDIATLPTFNLNIRDANDNLLSYPQTPIPFTDIKGEIIKGKELERFVIGWEAENWFIKVWRYLIGKGKWGLGLGFYGEL